MAFLSSFSRKYFYSVLAIGTVMSIGILLMENYRIQRLLSFLDPWKNPLTSGFQIIQSFLAFSNGGFKAGIGNSDEKLLYLPEAHNDFIFSVRVRSLALLESSFLWVSLFIRSIKGFGCLLVGKICFSPIYRRNCLCHCSPGLLNMGVFLGYCLQKD